MRADCQNPPLSVHRTDDNDDECCNYNNDDDSDDDSDDDNGGDNDGDDMMMTKKMKFVDFSSPPLSTCSSCKVCVINLSVCRPKGTGGKKTYLNSLEET